MNLLTKSLLVLSLTFFHTVKAGNRWDESILHSIKFFEPYFDEVSNSFPSEISFEGKVLSDKKI